ncbi:hypothetical protein llap_15374 [Limosa lapponica baueri]|uniref:Uncharacterized protein n=1 Tax=Limosa lapponica baueri TaxID=1758121 RepID=A0A2I0TKI7_LIMLA|nr:hypothetical protein llap_15374 [Limosa lapponica baueri]
MTLWNTYYNVGPKILFILVSFFYPEGFKFSSSTHIYKLFENNSDAFSRKWLPLYPARKLPEHCYLDFRYVMERNIW